MTRAIPKNSEPTKLEDPLAFLERFAWKKCFRAGSRPLRFL